MDDDDDDGVDIGTIVVDEASLLLRLVVVVVPSTKEWAVPMNRNGNKIRCRMVTRKDSCNLLFRLAVMML